MAIEQWWQFFPSSRFGFCEGGGGLCLSLVVVVASLGLHFRENRDFLHRRKNTRNNYPV